MSERIEFDWSEEWPRRDQLDGDKVLETFPADKLDRQKYAEFLTQFLADQGYDETSGEKRNYVLNLNSEWGSGKTYFLRRWAEDLKQNYPVVYVDAWKQDYSDDPLMTVISSMISQLREQAGSPEDKAVIKASRKLFGLLKAAAPSAARSLTKRYLGIDPVAIMEAEDDDQLGNATDEDGNPIDMGLAASKVVDHLISEHDAKAAAIESLKINVEQWVGAVVGRDQTREDDASKRSYPAFIFIDELDRCRPSYAVEMLETIKHIFDIPGVVFVVATDTEQLQHAVKAIYGEGFEARVYLGRFFNSRFSLKAPSFDNLLEVHCQKEKLDKAFFDEREIIVWPQNDNTQITIDNITSVLNAFDLSARTAIQITDRVVSTLSSLNRGKSVDLIMLTTLMCIREKDESLYNEIIEGTYERKVGNKNILLDDYLKDLFCLDDIGTKKQVKIDISPREITGKFRISRVQSYDNQYPDGEYVCSLEAYYSNIFRPFFLGKYSEMPAILDMGARRAEPKEPDEKIEIELYKLFHDHDRRHSPFDGERGLKWLEYTYLKSSMENRTSPQFYKDLVELASAIDWIDGEDEE